MLNRLPLDEALPALEQQLADTEQLRRELEARIAAYRRGDAQALSELDFAPGTESYEILLHQRNLAWLPQVEALLRGSEAAFVAVGISACPRPRRTPRAPPAPAASAVRRVGSRD